MLLVPFKHKKLFNLFPRHIFQFLAIILSIKHERLIREYFEHPILDIDREFDLLGRPSEIGLLVNKLYFAHRNTYQHVEDYDAHDTHEEEKDQLSHEGLFNT